MPDELSQAVQNLLLAERSGVLCTNSTSRRGYPFGSLTPYALDAKHRPVLLMSSMGVHAGNLKADPRASLFIAEGSGTGGALSQGRVNLMGRVVELPEDELAEARAAYLAAHPEALEWVDFGDFAFYRLEVETAYYVGGFGVMGWTTPSA